MSLGFKPMSIWCCACIERQNKNENGRVQTSVIGIKQCCTTKTTLHFWYNLFSWWQLVYRLHTLPNSELQQEFIYPRIFLCISCLSITDSSLESHLYRNQHLFFFYRHFTISFGSNSGGTIHRITQKQTNKHRNRIHLTNQTLQKLRVKLRHLNTLLFAVEPLVTEPSEGVWTRTRRRDGK